MNFLNVRDPGAEVDQFRGIKYSSVPMRFRRSLMNNTFPEKTDMTENEHEKALRVRSIIFNAFSISKRCSSFAKRWKREIDAAQSVLHPLSGYGNKVHGITGIVLDVLGECGTPSSRRRIQELCSVEVRKKVKFRMFVTDRLCSFRSANCHWPNGILTRT